MKLVKVNATGIHNPDFKLDEEKELGKYWKIEVGKEIGIEGKVVVIPLSVKDFPADTMPDADTHFSLVEVGDNDYLLVKSNKKDDKYLVILDIHSDSHLSVDYIIDDMENIKIINEGIFPVYNKFDLLYHYQYLPIAVVSKGAIIKWSYLDHRREIDKSYTLIYDNKGLRVKEGNHYKKSILLAFNYL